MKKGLIYSAIILTVGSLFAKFVGVFLKLPLINIVGDYGIGLYQLPYPIYTTVLTFTMTGFSLAVSKQISSSHAEKDYRACKLTFYTSLIVINSYFFYIFTCICVFIQKDYRNLQVATRGLYSILVVSTCTFSCLCTIIIQRVF